jgi:hypothetical protein
MRRCFLLAGFFPLMLASQIYAGMASPLPSGGPSRDDSVVARLSDFGVLRFQTLSFFLVVFLLSALAFQWLWNWLQRDFPWLSRLSFGKAVGVVFLWSLLLIIVLTMISGARELMTPGAWKKQGFTYKLAEDAKPQPQVDLVAERRQHLEKLRTALFQFAAFHQGRFPRSDEVSAIPDTLWEIPGAPGLRYLYVPDLAAGHVPHLLAYEPELGAGPRLVLCVNGDVLQKTTAEVLDLAKEGKEP